MTEGTNRPAAATDPLFEAVRDAVAVCGEDGTVLAWNRAAEALYALSRSEALGQHVAQAQLWKEPILFDEATRTSSESEPWCRELQQIRSDGLEITAQVRVLRTSTEPPTLLVLSEDRTDVKLVNDERLRSQRMDTLGNLVGGISHDLKNVLTPILLASTLLETSLEDPDDLELLETLRRSANRGVNMVQQLLWFYKGGAERTVLDARTVLRELRQMMKESFPKSIDVRVLTPLELPSIRGNATQIYQMLLNLCVNARDAMAEGGRLTLRVDRALRTVEGEERAFVHFSVEDEGPGIPDEEHERVFELLYTTKSQHGGSGVGLATVAHIAEEHGGFVEIESGRTTGARFDIYLPVTHATREASDSAEPIAAPNGAGRTVLVVEDEPALRLMTDEALRSHGYATLTAAHGAEAVEIFRDRADEIDLVLTDLNMPVMDGKATIRALREIDPDARLLATSALPAEIRERQIDDSIPFLRKPYEVQDLLHSVARVARTRETAER